MKYALLAFTIVAVVIFGILGIITLFNQRPPEPAPQPNPITNYLESDSSLVYTTRGAIVANENFRSIRISVSETERTLQVLAGYAAEPQVDETYENSPEAYEPFVRAVAAAGFSQKLEKPLGRELGACPLGRVFGFEIRSRDVAIERSWSSTCGKKLGDFGGNTTLIRQLFERQIPEYKTLTRGVRL